MKGKIIALLAAFLVSGSAGVLVTKNAPAQASTKIAVPTYVQNSAASNALAAAKNPTVNSAVQSALKQAQATAKSTKSCPKTSAKPASAASQPASTSAASNVPSTNVSTSGNGTIITKVISNCPNSQNSANYVDYINNLLKSLTNGQYSLNTSSGTGSKTTSSSAPVSSTPSKTTSSTAPASSAPATGSGYSDFQNQVVSLVNQQRAANGLKALTVDSALTNTATLKSQDMAKLGYFDHTSPTYGSPFDMMQKYGISFNTAGENIAMGQTTPAQVMNDWMNSPGHRANILNSSFTKIGVGIAQNSNGQYYWTQQFIG